MTDRDETKGFLERWSRKKLDAEREAPAAPAQPEGDDALPPERHAKTDNKIETKIGTNTSAAAAKPAFDLASLPSLDSITAATDIRAFLTPGVPADLARAALRRAWAADPGIRDFKGLAENDWDFTDPTAMPGFGALPPGTDITKMLAQIFGEGEKPADPDAAIEPPAVSEPSPIAKESAAPEVAVEAAEPAGENVEVFPPDSFAASGQADFVHRNNNTAVHKSSSDDDTVERKTRRHHGGALPQ